jgi:hypothetical protein
MPPYWHLQFFLCRRRRQRTDRLVGRPRMDECLDRIQNFIAKVVHEKIKRVSSHAAAEMLEVVILHEQPGMAGNPPILSLAFQGISMRLQPGHQVRLAGCLDLIGGVDTHFHTSPMKQKNRIFQSAPAIATDNKVNSRMLSVNIYLKNHHSI